MVIEHCGCFFLPALVRTEHRTRLATRALRVQVNGISVLSESAESQTLVQWVIQDLRSAAPVPDWIARGPRAVTLSSTDRGANRAANKFYPTPASLTEAVVRISGSQLDAKSRHRSKQCHSTCGPVTQWGVPSGLTRQLSCSDLKPNHRRHFHSR
jgi:hypothetical protein